MKTLEVCIDSVESGLAAVEGGADRIELCSALVIGGLSPSLSFYKELRNAGVKLPVRAMVRPRCGDFLYTDAEKAIMLDETRAWRDAGVEGVVTGALTKDGALDVDFLRAFMEASKGMRRTLHRAFDVTADAFAALETAIELGFDTILTSGQEENARKGTKLIAELQRRAAGRIEILVGGDVLADVITEMRPVTGCTNFHLSGNRTLKSDMVFRREGVPMGLPCFDEFTLWRSDPTIIRAAKDALLAE